MTSASSRRASPSSPSPPEAFDLPTEREAAEQVIEKLFTAMERIGQVHPFAKGMGLAAPQIAPEFDERPDTSPEPGAERGSRGRPRGLRVPADPGGSGRIRADPARTSAQEAS